MILFFGDITSQIFAVQVSTELIPDDVQKLSWLFGDQEKIDSKTIKADLVGPRASMISPWSTNAVEITQNMGIAGVERIEKYLPDDPKVGFDPMLSQKFDGLDQEIFKIDIEPAPILEIDDIAAYNKSEGLALSDEEVEYLVKLSQRLERKLTDSEVFGFSQVNSEHCRHKIFNGTFVIDGEEMPSSLFKLIKKTSAEHPNDIVSAYKDNVAFLKGPELTHFSPKCPDRPSYYHKKKFESVISLKAETHNFPTTVEPFNGAATGSGGEIRDRLAGGKGSLPLAGTALYMTAYSRLNKNREWESGMQERNWLYQTPIDILIKASNGASDFGNKFGQPLINGSLLTFEHEEVDKRYGYDKVIMQAGGIGFGKASEAIKEKPDVGDLIVILGGDNYRIGMGGAAVSSADTGEFSSGIELNAIQRSNPEMQKRVADTIRGFIESGNNAIVSIHDHGAGGHLNCLSELVEETGGKILLNRLPIGDPTLSAKEIIGNESQERMGLVIAASDLDQLKAIADRERAPLYIVGEVTGNHRFTFEGANGEKPMNLNLSDMFGSSPKTIMNDQKIKSNFDEVVYKQDQLDSYLVNVLKLESVACKDWLTNKVDRCVGGRVAKQQCVGPLQLPLNNCGVMALDYESGQGIATSMGHAPIAGLIDAKEGARLAITEALSNIVWAPLKQNIKSISLSANWMWPCRNSGEDARLYEAVKSVSDYCIALGINVPTGKDSLSMKQKYPDGEVLSPGTVVISAAGHCHDITRIVEPVLKADGGDIYYIPLTDENFVLGGSAFAQTRNKIGKHCPSVFEAEKVVGVFKSIQKALGRDLIQAGHDVSSGGLITCLLEMCFADNDISAEIDLSELHCDDHVKLLFAENPALVIQAKQGIEKHFRKQNVGFYKIGSVKEGTILKLTNGSSDFDFDIPGLRDEWYETSYLLDQKQSGVTKAKERFENYKSQELKFTFPSFFFGRKPLIHNKVNRPKAAVIREKGSNSEREMANAMYLAGFDVKDVHMTDLISGREDLSEVQFIGAVGGFSNSDVLGSAKGWAGAFKYNEKARMSLENFFKRDDVLSVGICNGCQLFVELDLINPEHELKSKMLHNDSGKHESAFTSVIIQENNSVMLSSLAGSKLGVWISHGEGKFYLPEDEEKYGIVAKYAYDAYPSNPNGSDYNAAMICSADGRHLVTMPHIERSTFQWNWAHYPAGRKDEVTPWIEAFVNARRWIEKASPSNP